MTDNEYRVVKSSRSARGAVLGRPVLVLLLTSCALAAVALASVYLDFFGPLLGR